MSTELRGKSSSQISAVGIMATLGLGMLVGKGKPFLLENYFLDKYHNCFKHISLCLLTSRAVRAYFKWKDWVRGSNDQHMCSKWDIHMVELEVL